MDKPLADTGQFITLLVHANSSTLPIAQLQAINGNSLVLTGSQHESATAIADKAFNLIIVDMSLDGLSLVTLAKSPNCINCNTPIIALLNNVVDSDQKKQLIAEHMKISKADSAKFWSMYDVYETSRKAIGKKRAANIEAYAKSYDNLTNEKAGTLINTSFAVYNDFGKLWKDTYTKMAKAISPVTAGKFIQVEMYLENLVRNELADEIPLIGEFEPKK